MDNEYFTILPEVVLLDGQRQCPAMFVLVSLHTMPPGESVDHHGAASPLPPVRHGQNFAKRDYHLAQLASSCCRYNYGVCKKIKDDEFDIVFRDKVN